MNSPSGRGYQTAARRQTRNVYRENHLFQRGRGFLPRSNTPHLMRDILRKLDFSLPSIGEGDRN
ncbi:hypothetical protein CVV65_02235 [Kyrpidia spormannii]|uniref:Uncharacterized protein n=1 Tax=Kyrpidia spormannii TaxID=2055160 RepID=A0A2K8N335_9BACL|nr:hypothetical protein CVV65_02235 [Kyrpidia spormannii]